MGSVWAIRQVVLESPLFAHSRRRPESASGGSARLFGISKRGDRYLRTLLIHGARSALGRVRDKQDPRSLWLGKMRQRRHPNIVTVALANKNARIAWSLLTSDSVYDVRLSVRAA
jgi:transposase